MAALQASSNPIIIDLNSGVWGGSTIGYFKAPTDEIWHRFQGGPWQSDPDPTVAFDGLVSDFPDLEGSFPVLLRPGEIWEIAIFAQDHGPLADPILLARLTLFAIAKQPKSNLITSEDWNTGGTWHSHTVSTNAPTHLVVATASRTPLAFNNDGYPFPGQSDGATVISPGLANSHTVTTMPLLPGTPYTYLMVVVNGNGRWDYRTRAVVTLRRRFTVQFKTLRIFNDGDEADYGEARFRCRVMFMNGPGKPEIIEEFVRPEDDVDDWSETDRPYALGFAHVGDLRAVIDGQQRVWVSSFGNEDDWPLPDEMAWSVDAALPFPVGPGENVPNAQFLLDCPNVTDSDFHYGVDIQWSVNYEA